MVDRCTVTGVIDWTQAGFRPIGNIVNRRDLKYTLVVLDIKIYPELEEEVRTIKWPLGTLFNPRKHAI